MKSLDRQTGRQTDIDIYIDTDMSMDIWISVSSLGFYSGIHIWSSRILWSEFTELYVKCTCIFICILFEILKAILWLTPQIHYTYSRNYLSWSTSIPGSYLACENKSNRALEHGCECACAICRSLCIFSLGFV